MKKKILCLVTVALMLIGTTVSANSDNNEISSFGDTRYLYFATEGGQNVDFLSLPCGTKIDLNEYIPEKAGYEFDGWYYHPIETENRLTEIILENNTVLWAKWKVKEGVTEQQLENGVLSRTVIGNNVVLQTLDNEIKIVPVTDLWANQNARLEGLMKVYNEKFN